MSHFATWQGRPRVGIDHAIAAEQWAQRTDDMRLRTYTADVAARAYAADGQRDACLSALNTVHAVLMRAHDQTPSLHPQYDEATHVSIRGFCHLTLGDTDHTIGYAQHALKGLDGSNTRDVAMTIVDLGEAYAQRNEIDEAARLFGDASDIVARFPAGSYGNSTTACTALIYP